jgi:hypothetical protein
MPQEPKPQDSVEIMKEKQKTIRWAIFIGAFVILGGGGIFLGKNMKLNFKTGELEVTKPIVEQIKQNTTTDPNTNLNFTTGELTSETSKKIKELPDISPQKFSGKNYINTEFGYLFTCEHPDKWNISYTPSNFNTGEPMNVIEASNGLEFKLIVSDNDTKVSLQELVNVLITGSTITNEQIPEVTFDKDGRTAFFRTFVKAFNKEALMKVIVTPTRGYIAAAYYPEEMKSNWAVNEFEKMVASFTLF